LYFNDDVYVGQVHNGKFLEFVSFDPMQGAIFYVMDEAKDEHPRFERAEIDCVQCHVAGSTRGIPGVLLRSVYTRSDGYPDAAMPSFVTGQESPLDQRWGGWYVTAKSGSEGGMENATISDPKHPERLDRAAGADQSSLAGRFDTAAYLADKSDIVALMVLAHQTQMHNLVTLTNYQTRLALFAEQKRNLSLSLPSETVSDGAPKRWEAPAEQLVRYLLFTNEVPLKNPGLSRNSQLAVPGILVAARCGISISNTGSSNTPAAILFTPATSMPFPRRRKSTSTAGYLKS
jgi:hypothetical protein